MNLPIDVNKIIEIFEAGKGKIGYGWGDKIPLTASKEDYLKMGIKNGIDCSGFVAYAAAFASGGEVKLTAYSVAIGDELQNMVRSGKVKKVAYADVYSKQDDILRIAGYDKGGKNRHVWFTLNGKTMESAGGGKGVSSRSASVFRTSTQWCYEVASLQKEVTPDKNNLSLVLEDSEENIIKKLNNAGYLDAGEGRTYIKTAQLKELLAGKFEVTFDKQSGNIFLKEVKKIP